jgi:hypothetical protein
VFVPHPQNAFLSFPDNWVVVEKCLCVFHVLAFDGLNRSLLGKSEAHDLVISAINEYVNVRGTFSYIGMTVNE